MNSEMLSFALLPSSLLPYFLSSAEAKEGRVMAIFTLNDDNPSIVYTGPWERGGSMGMGDSNGSLHMLLQETWILLRQ